MSLLFVPVQRIQRLGRCKDFNSYVSSPGSDEAQAKARMDPRKPSRLPRGLSHGGGEGEPGSPRSSPTDLFYRLRVVELHIPALHEAVRRAGGTVHALRGPRTRWQQPATN